MKYILSILSLLLTLSCVSLPNQNSNWPLLSQFEWEDMTAERFEYLIESGIEINATTPQGYSGLMFAAELNTNVKLLSAMLESGMDINAITNDGETALMVAAIINSNPEIISLMLQSGADINIRNKFGLNAFGLACMYSRYPRNIIQLLQYEVNNVGFNKLDKTLTDINSRTSDGNNQLMLEARSGDGISSIEELISKGISNNSVNAYGWSATAIAAVFSKDVEKIKLLNSFQPVNNPKSEEDYSILMLTSAVNNQVENLQQLIDAGQEINNQSKSGWTPLMFACYGNSSSDVISFLIKNGADVKLMNNQGQTAWDIIQENSNLIGTTGYWELNDKLRQ